MPKNRYELLYYMINGYTLTKLIIVRCKKSIIENQINDYQINFIFLFSKRKILNVHFEVEKKKRNGKKTEKIKDKYIISYAD